MYQCANLRKKLFWQAMQEEHAAIQAFYADYAARNRDGLVVYRSTWVSAPETRLGEVQMKKELFEQYGEYFHQEVDDAYGKWLPALKPTIDRICSLATTIHDQTITNDPLERVKLGQEYGNLWDRLSTQVFELTKKRIEQGIGRQLTGPFINPYDEIVRAIHLFFDSPDGILHEGGLKTCQDLDAMPEGSFVWTKRWERLPVSAETAAPPPHRSPRVRMVRLQSGYEIPKDWTELSKIQQELITNMRASTSFPVNSLIAKIMNQPPSKIKPDLDELNELDLPPTPPITKGAVSLEPEETGGYSAEELIKAHTLLEEAVDLEKAGKLPTVREILLEWTQRQGGDRSAEEQAEAERDFRTRLDARRRLDLSRAQEQRQVFKADEQARSFSELMPDGTIHTCEKQFLGQDIWHKVEEWSYADGTSVTWSGSYEQSATAEAGTHVYKGETIEVYDNPDQQQIYSSVVTQTQVGAGQTDSGPAPLPPAEMQAKLEQLRQMHRHGPWE